MAQYDAEQVELEARVTEIENQQDKLRKEEKKGEMSVQLAHKYRDFTEITKPMLNEFIDRISVHEANGGRGANRTQEIEIYFNFIGQFVPAKSQASGLSPEEVKRQEEEKAKERRRRNTAAVRRYRQRKKEEIAAEAAAV